MLESGFTDVHSERVTVAFEFTSGEDYTRYSQATSPSARDPKKPKREKKTSGRGWQNKLRGIMELMMAT